MYSSSAFWSDTLTLALHAEHATLAHGAAHGHRANLAIVCVSIADKNTEELCHPCGICKQLIYESSLSSGIDVLVIMANLKGECRNANLRYDRIPSVVSVENLISSFASSCEATSGGNAFWDIVFRSDPVLLLERTRSTPKPA